MKANPSNNVGEPASDGWYLAESMHEYDEQDRLIRSHAVGSRHQPAPHADPARTQGQRTEGAGFVKQIEHQQDEAVKGSVLTIDN